MEIEKTRYGKRVRRIRKYGKKPYKKQKMSYKLFKNTLLKASETKYYSADVPVDNW